LRRTLAIARQLAGDLKDVYQLLLTGSMVAGAFTLPSRLDILKLPALSKRSSGQYKSRALPLTLKSILAWRQRMILEAAIHFKPDLLLVDKSPAGVHGELLPTLRHLKTWSPKTVLVLGMRDIEDSPEKTRAEWEAAGVPQLFDQVYDSILLYGQRDFFDPVDKYRISAAAAAKMVECGYLGRNDVTRDAAWVRRELGVGDDPLVVVTVGGGGIPVIRNDEGDLQGVAAVIDKDFASSLLARSIGADLFLISTAVEQVYLNFGKPDQQAIDVMTVPEAKLHMEEGHFAKGSMLPKIQAVIWFLETGGQEALITNPENITRALRGETGTRVVP